MSAAFADRPRGSGPRAGETWRRARARRICARALALALDPTVDTAAAATELAVLAGGDPSAVVRAIAFVRTAGARPSPVNDRAERALVATLAALVADRAAGRPDRPDRDP